MKTSRLLFLIAGFAVFVISTGIAQPRIGAKAGLNLANMNFSDEFIGVETKMLPTFMVGAVVEFDFSENIGLGTGLQYHGKGYQSDISGDDSKATLAYLQVPIQLQYRSNGLFAAVGPYVAFGIGGKFKDGDDEEDVDFGSSIDDDISALDFGVNIELGYEFTPALRATVGYGLGLASALPSDQQDLIDGDVKHAVIGVALTYLFGQQ
jgi:hypothetical protein